MADAQVTPRPDGTWTLVTDDVRVVAHAVTDAAGTVWVHLDGEVVAVAAETRTRGAATVSAADLEAPMPSQVIAVLVAPGAEVAAGAPLLLLEAMKMELPLRAPRAARVRAVHCRVGERVGPGRALVDLDPLEPSA